MTERYIYFDEIGHVRFVKSKKARRVTINVLSVDDVKVSIPTRETYNTATLFVEKKRKWIKKHIDRLRVSNSNKIIFDEYTNFRTKHHSLRIIPNLSDSFSIKTLNESIVVKYPLAQDVYSDSAQSIIRNAIENVLRIEAKVYIPRRVHELAEKYNFNFNRIFIKNIKSRWGSCSKKGNLNFSIHLMMLPDEMIDYVILHELAHTVKHNHSSEYWAVLDKIYGDSKAVDKQLKNYGIGFYTSNHLKE